MKLLDAALSRLTGVPMCTAMGPGTTSGSASSQADTLEQRAWTPRKGVSLAIRVGAFLVPLLTGVLAVRVVASVVARPAGAGPFVAWMALLIGVSMSSSIGAQRLARRVVPLAALFQMSLVFPDRAPSRFRTAMRASSSRSLARSLKESAAGGGAPTSPEQVAAEVLVGIMARMQRHDRLTRGHSERVRGYSVMLGQQIGLSADDLDKLNWAALAHDVGKLSVPAEILNKAGRPTDEEWKVLRGHPRAAEQYVETLRPWLGDWIEAATHHHERFDGTGYPNGRTGAEISLGARIVALCDAYDVMTATRSYKAPLPAAQARAELLRCAGTHFDPVLVRSFLEISLGKERWIAGALGWMAHVPEIMRVPMTMATSSGTSLVGAAAVSIAAATGAAAVVPVTEPPPVVEISAGLPADDTIAESATTLFLPMVDISTVPPTGDELPAANFGEVAALPDAVGLPTATTAFVEVPTESPGGGIPAAPLIEPATTEPFVVTTTPPAAPSTTSAPTTAPTTAAPVPVPAAPPATTVPTIPVPPPAAQPASPLTWNLGRGLVTFSVPFLPLGGTLLDGPLPNYDADRDSDPGLLFKNGAGLTETDATRMQRWWTPMVSATRVTGTPTLDLWVATWDFKPLRGAVEVGLYDCSFFGSSCTLLSSAGASFDQESFGAAFGMISVALPAIDATIAAGRSLVLKVASDDSAEGHLWLAYGTATYPSVLRVA